MDDVTQNVFALNNINLQQHQPRPAIMDLEAKNMYPFHLTQD